MSCPNCSHLMNYVSLDKQNILHCSNCGASFFEENAINRITSTSAHKLAADKKSDDISGVEKVCPLDHAPLRPIEESEALPPNVTLLKCERCQGVLAFSDDLLAFKKAQGAKIEFFKAWAKPLPSLRTVLVVSFTVFLLGTVIYQSNSFLNRFPQYTQASDLITKINFTRSGRYLLVFFKTKLPMQSKIIFEDKDNNSTLEKIITDQPSTIHQLTIGDLNLVNEIWYKIILINNSSQKIETELKKITF